MQKNHQPMERILKRIVQTRKQKGYSLENMANELNISESTYRKIENNQINLSLERFLLIAKFLIFQSMTCLEINHIENTTNTITIKEHS